MTSGRLRSLSTGRIRTYEDWLHQELLNWARWCWSGGWPHPIPPDHCASLEGQYQAPPWEDEPESVRKMPEPNAERARIVEKVWSRLPDGPRFVLRWEYPCWWWQVEVHRAARTLRMSVTHYEGNLLVAIGRVRKAFEEEGIAA